ncbi:hypothetical protein GCM10027020_37850 [Nocardioides salsibiostraticola]
MKLARRRASRSTDDTAGPNTAEQPDPSTAPRGAPVASFVGILDGQSLWVAVELTPGSIALRHTGTGDVVALTNDAPDDQPAYTSARMDLGGLTATEASEPATYDVVIVPTSGRSPRPIWSAPLPGARVAPTRDERTQWGLDQTPDGYLQITCTDLEPTAWLAGVVEESDGVRLTIANDEEITADAEVALLSDGEVVARFPTSATESGLSALLTGAPTDGPTGSPTDSWALDESIDVQTRVVIGVPGHWVPIRRRHDDLPDPGRGAPLPPVNLPGSETARIRLRFGGEAFLVARILPVSATDPTIEPSVNGETS